ncbi:MAG: exodeoxyribonuclease I [Pseudomonadota bacterium]
MSTQSLFWYDLETTGRDPARDRILQFAGQRTDLELNPVGPPVNLLCKPPVDVLPDPEAIALTGLSVTQCEARGLGEFDFAKSVLAAFEPAGTCVVGYNSVRFDDEFLRHLFYRNLMDPYAREWQDKRSRWDLIDTVRLCRALRPEGIHWPTDDNGRATNRLESLSTANALQHTAAHDALSDVEATLAVARLLRDRQPRLYDYAFTHRDKHSARQLLAPHNPEPCLHISGMYGADQHFCAIVAPIAEHPTNPNGILVADLRHAATPFLNLDPDALRARWFANADTLGSTPRFPVKTVHLNKCPVLAPLSVLRTSDAARLGLNTAVAAKHLSGWLTDTLRDTVHGVLAAPGFTPADDPELQLYSGGFFSGKDRAAMQRTVDAAGANVPPARDTAFDDPRLPVLLERMRARNWPATLSAAEAQRWQAWVGRVLDEPSVRTVNRARFVARARQLKTEQPEVGGLMDELLAHYAPVLN